MDQLSSYSASQNSFIDHINKTSQIGNPKNIERLSFQEKIYSFVRGIFEALGILQAITSKSINGKKESSTEFKINGSIGFEGRNGPIQIDRQRKSYSSEILKAADKVAERISAIPDSEFTRERFALVAPVSNRSSQQASMSIEEFVKNHLTDEQIKALPLGPSLELFGALIKEKNLFSGDLQQEMIAFVSPYPSNQEELIRGLQNLVAKLNPEEKEALKSFIGTMHRVAQFEGGHHNPYKVALSLEDTLSVTNEPVQRVLAIIFTDLLIRNYSDVFSFEGSH